MEKINLMVLRKIGRMKRRTVGISFVVAMAVATFITGLYSADVFDYSSETMLENSKMPDIFVEVVGKAARERVMAPFADLFEVVAAQLGDDASVLGAAAWAAEALSASGGSSQTRGADTGP